MIKRENQPCILFFCFFEEHILVTYYNYHRIIFLFLLFFELMLNSYEEIIESLRILPRFDSQTLFHQHHSEQVYSYSTLVSKSFVFHDSENEKLSPSNVEYLLLPKFDFQHGRTFYDENQSADVTQNISKETKTNIDDHQKMSYPSKKDEM